MNPRRDITGQRSGKLLALWPAGRDIRQGQIFLFWMAQCDCGETSLIRTSDFRRRKHSHCRHNLHKLLKGADYYRYWRHRLFPSEWKDLFARQEGKCAICGDILGQRQLTHLDHDHSCCGKKKSCSKCRRGILCHLCNTAIGKLKESPQIIRKAAEYLESWHH